MKNILATSIAAATIILSGCNESDSSAKPGTIKISGDYSAIILQADYASGSNVAIADPSDLSNIVENYYADTASDYTLASDGEYYYHIGRSDTGVISKYKTDAPQANYYGNGYALTTAGQETGSNVHDIGFLPDGLAILTRYSQKSAWIVDRDANTSSDFKRAEIDLGSYVAADDTQSPAPEMDDVVVYGNKAFITLQRQGTEDKSYGLVRPAYVAVIDTDKRQEINTGKGSEGLKGIKLEIANPINVSSEDKYLYIQGINYSANKTGEYTGGLVRIDMTNYEQTVIFQPTSQTGSISDLAVINGNIFVIIYDDWQNNTLARLNIDGSLTKASAFSAMNLTFIQEGPEGNLWLGRGADTSNNSAVLKLSITDFSVIDQVETTLDPIGITFVNN